MDPKTRLRGHAVAALSAKVRWLSPSSIRRRAASAAPVMTGFAPPPIGLASRRPSCLTAAAHRYAVERPTAKRRAAASGLSPASTAAKTRLRRSVDYAPAIINTSAQQYGRRRPNLPAVRSSTTAGVGALWLSFEGG
jgi:hypothetical protein